MSGNPTGVMRGLSLFIGDVRNCQNREQEEKLVYKEMAKIRQKFQNKGISGYDKKKYVWKLIYAHIMGYDVDFGHEEALNLINAMKYTEKCTGYIATGIMLNEKSDPRIFERVFASIKNDVNCGNEVAESLALTTVGNIGSVEFANELSDIVMQKAFGEVPSSVNVKKRACLTLLSFLKRNRSIYKGERWVRGFNHLLKQEDKGLLLSACSLLLGTINIVGRNDFHSLVPLIVQNLAHVDQNAQNYYYYMTPCPWL